MQAVLRWFRQLRLLFQRGKFRDDLTEEMAFHREQAEQQLQSDGMSSESARHAAARQFGNTTRLREQSQEIVRFRFETAVQDSRYGLRQLRRNPGFSLAAILVLALGIGATTAIFSAVNPILFEPLPYPDAGRIMTIWYRAPDGSSVQQAFGTYREVAQRSRSFDDLAVVKPWQPTMTSATEPERVDGQRVSASYFRVLGVRPALGRDFQASDDRFKGPDVAILSDALWRRRFGGDNTIVGRQIRLDDNLFTVIGVMPPDLENVLAPSAEIWSPLQYDMSLGTAWGHHLRMVGRLRPGISRDQARSELDLIARTPMSEFPRVKWAALENGFIVNSLQSDVTSGIKPALLAVLGAVLLLLVIASVNVTNLLLARGAQRRGEFAMRAALGAEPVRLVRQLLTESLLLAVIGGALGIAAAKFGVRALVALSPPGLPRANAIAVDGAVLGFAIGITTLIGLLVGLIPAVSAARSDPHSRLQQNSLHTAGGHQFTRHVLVIAEVSLAFVLLVSAGLLLRSLQRLFAIDPGFNASHLLTMQVQTSGHRFDKDTTDRFFTQTLEAVRKVPGVAAAALTSQLPLSGEDDEYGARFEGDDPNLGYSVFRYAVSPGYFDATGIPLRLGRALDARDTAGAPLAVVVSESLARAKFKGQDPIGRRVRIGPVNGPWFTIVGVAGNIKQASLAANQSWAVYITTPQSWFVDNVLTLVIRTRGDAAALAPAVRDAIWSVDKDQPVVRVATMDSLLATSEAQRRFALILFEAFGILALALAAAGIYGVLSGSVNERMREIGIRSALGATRGALLALVLRQGAKLATIGIGIGLAGAVLASQALVTLLFSTSRLDPLSYLSVGVLLMAISIIACWVPAWRAARVDPSITLRAE
jgi:putative ABC transport system permease protein